VSIELVDQASRETDFKKEIARIFAMLDFMNLTRHGLGDARFFTTNRFKRRKRISCFNYNGLQKNFPSRKPSTSWLIAAYRRCMDLLPSEQSNA
jgi:hypothetical protein